MRTTISQQGQFDPAKAHLTVAIAPVDPLQSALAQPLLLELHWQSPCIRLCARCWKRWSLGGIELPEAAGPYGTEGGGRFLGTDSRAFADLESPADFPLEAILRAAAPQGLDQGRLCAGALKCNALWLPSQKGITAERPQKHRRSWKPAGAALGFGWWAAGPQATANGL